LLPYVLFERKYLYFSIGNCRPGGTSTVPIVSGGLSFPVHETNIAKDLEVPTVTVTEEIRVIDSDVLRTVRIARRIFAAPDERTGREWIKKRRHDGRRDGGVYRTWRDREKGKRGKK